MDKMGVEGSARGDERFQWVLVSSKMIVDGHDWLSSLSNGTPSVLCICIPLLVPDFNSWGCIAFGSSQHAYFAFTLLRDRNFSEGKLHSKDFCSLQSNSAPARIPIYLIIFQLGRNRKHIHALVGCFFPFCMRLII
jgi:hypothetical protein